jgi:hypothetical protein
MPAVAIVAVPAVLVFMEITTSTGRVDYWEVTWKLWLTGVAAA